jgi:hypothetical protein
MKDRPLELFSWICFGLVLTQGCGKEQPAFQPISGGFGVVTKWVGVDSGPGAKLFYKDTGGKLILIWPFLGLSDAPMLFTNDLAFFVGEMPDDQERFGDELYIAVQSSGSPIDVSEDLLKFSAESNHLDFAKLRGTTSCSKWKRFQTESE